ncbi:MAG: hypothetical protein M3M97_03920 [Actinomycetota bacterium]|nr:hypothetical protein [Actinomycetota bacterium]
MQEYEKAGGGYEGQKAEDQKSLEKWTEEEWRTKEGDERAREGDEMSRYLSKKAWENLSPRRGRKRRESSARVPKRASSTSIPAGREGGPQGDAGTYREL